MKIAVCIKRVPSTETKIRIATDGKSLDLSGVEYVLNPYDEFAVEEGLQLKEKLGGEEVVVVSYGPDDCKTQMRTALAMGADRGVLVKAADTGTDPAAVGKGLAAALKEIGADLVLFGKQAVDDDNAQVPAWTAKELGIPLVNVVTKAEFADGKGTLHRQIEGGTEVVEVSLPAAFTCQKGLNEPRYPSLPNIMKAKKKPIEEKEAPAAEPLIEVEKMELPPPRPEGKIVGEGKEAVPELVRLLREEAKVI